MFLHYISVSEVRCSGRTEDFTVMVRRADSVFLVKVMQCTDRTLKETLSVLCCTIVYM